MGLPKLLITGSNGLIGAILVSQLSDAYEIFGVDISLNRETTNFLRADISDYRKFVRVLKRIAPLNFILHLAADPHPRSDWQSILKNNIITTCNVYQAASQFSVQRVVFASSNHVTGGYEGFPNHPPTKPEKGMITTSDPLRPDGYYAVSKVFGEALARMYYESSGLESICLRIGSVLKEDDPGQDERLRRTWLSHRDLVQLVRKSLESEVKFGIYYGVSNNQDRFWDISNAVAELAFQPQDGASTL